jgi:hypothetical protein
MIYHGLGAENQADAEKLTGFGIATKNPFVISGI